MRALPCRAWVATGARDPWALVLPLLPLLLLVVGGFSGCHVDFGGGGGDKDAAVPDGEPEVDAAGPECGDGVLNLDEECDGADLGGETCETVVGANTSGDLACLSSCLFDTSECVPMGCGDGDVTGTEECDDGNQSNEDGCLNNCLVATCGDGHTWPAHEECDDGNASDEDGCVNQCELATCGDGHLWVGTEECEGTDLGGATCEDMGFAGGDLSCAANCELDTSACAACGSCKTCTVAECYRDIYWWEDAACTVPSSGCQPCADWGPASSYHSDGSFFCNPNSPSSPFWNGGPCTWVDTVYTNDCTECGSWVCP